MATFNSIQAGSQTGTAVSQHDLRNLAREHAKDALDLIIRVHNNPKATPQARIAAARSLLERGWGESLQERVRPHRLDALNTLLTIMYDTGASLRTRLAAAEVLLDCSSNESRTRVTPTVSHDRERWLDELREIRAQFADDRPALERPSSPHN